MAATFTDYIISCYNPRVYSNNSCSSFSESCSTPSPEKYRPLSKFMKIPLDGSVIEFPCMYQSFIEHALHNGSRSNFYIPLVCLYDDDYLYKSSSSIIRDAFYKAQSIYNLKAFKTSNVTYLGGKGIIMYEDYTPLIMFTLVIRREQDYKYTPIQQIIRVNPIIYNNEDILAKYLKSKFLSSVFASEYDNYWNNRLYDYNHIYTSQHLNWKFKVIVSDFSDFFVSPIIPDTSFNSTKVNEFLLSNYDSIVWN